MEPRKLDTLLKIAQIAALISLTAAVIAGLFALPELRRQVELHLRVTRLVHMKELSELVERGRRADARIKAFLDRIPDGQGACAAPPCIPSPDELFQRSNRTGRDMYYSGELAEFVGIGRMYEDLGALIRLGYGDFDFAYTLLNFPDAFWEKTVLYRRLIQDNWSGEGRPLPDFWMNFSWLRDEYLKERRRSR